MLYGRLVVNVRPLKCHIPVREGKILKIPQPNAPNNYWKTLFPHSDMDSAKEQISGNEEN